MHPSGHPGDAHTPGPHLDEEQHVEGPQEHRLHREEVAAHDARCLRPQELRPGGAGASWCWWDAGPAEKRADGSRADPVAESLQLALDPDDPQPGLSLAICTIRPPSEASR